MPTHHIAIEELEKLVRELQRLGWETHLKPLRELQVAVRDGGRADWSLTHAARLASYVGLGRKPLQVMPCGAPCPRCTPPQFSIHVSAQLPDRKVMECSKCGTDWITLS